MSPTRSGVKKCGSAFTIVKRPMASPPARKGTPSQLRSTSVCARSPHPGSALVSSMLRLRPVLSTVFTAAFFPVSKVSKGLSQKSGLPEGVKMARTRRRELESRIITFARS